jgi:hypothetical protein
MRELGDHERARNAMTLAPTLKPHGYAGALHTFSKFTVIPSEAE